MFGKKLMGDVPITKDLLLLIAIGGLYSLSVALSNTFVNVFLWKQSGSFFDIGLYNITVVIFQPITFILAGKLVKIMDRVLVLRMGVFSLAAFYFAVLMVGDQASEYLILLGAILGIGYGFYWLAFNVLTFEITEPENRAFFNGFSGAISSLGGMIAPLTAGFIITNTLGNKGYDIIFSLSMLLFAAAIVLSFFINYRSAHGKYSFLQILGERKRNNDWKRITLAHFFQGLREGTFVFIVSIFIYISTGNELSLGTFGLINSSIAFFTYYAVSRFVKKQHRNVSIFLGAVGLFGSVFLLIINVSYINLLLYGACIAIFYPLLLVPYISLTYDVIGKGWKAAELRVEYIVVREVFLNTGRFLSILLFLVAISSFDIKVIMPYILFILGAGHVMIYFCVKGINVK